MMIEVPITKDNINIGKSYNRDALEGLLEFLEALYEDLISDINKGMNPLEAINSELDEIKRLRKIWVG